MKTRHLLVLVMLTLCSSSALAGDVLYARFWRQAVRFQTLAENSTTTYALIPASENLLTSAKGLAQDVPADAKVIGGDARKSLIMNYRLRIGDLVNAVSDLHESAKRGDRADVLAKIRKVRRMRSHIYEDYVR